MTASAVAVMARGKQPWVEGLPDRLPLPFMPNPAGRALAPRLKAAVVPAGRMPSTGSATLAAQGNGVAFAAWRDRCQSGDSSSYQQLWNPFPRPGLSNRFQIGNRSPAMESSQNAAIEEQLEGLIQDLVGSRNAVDWNEDLLNLGVVASIHMLELVLFMEERFGVTIDPFGLSPEHFQSINAMARFVRERGGLCG